MPDEIITCPKCGYNVQGPEQWGCHCDLEDGKTPDACVFDNGDWRDCTFAVYLYREGKSKADCEYWRKW